MNIIITERGWGGHLICAHKCHFRRNTLIELGDKRIVVSTVGAMKNEDYSYEEIGVDRHFETMAFDAHYTEPYWDACVHKQLNFESQWCIKGVDFTSDNRANDMHDTVVKEFCKKLKQENKSEV